MTSVDVFVAGGGPAGLAAAIAAHRKGLSVALADALQPPIDKACGEGLMPDALEALGALGVAVPASESAPFDGIRFLGCDATVQAGFPRGAGLGLRRTTLHRLLIDQAERLGVRLMWGAGVRGFDGHIVYAGAEAVRARWIVGADGGASLIRRQAGLDGSARLSRRFAFRRHYRLAPWSRFMEIWWGPGCQIYVTPVAGDSLCLAVISRDAQLRPDQALDRFPELCRRLAGAQVISADRGAVSATRRLRAVCTGHVSLIGDASGSVDAITGDGLCLAFRQGLALAEAFVANDLPAYQREHRRIGRRPAFMGDFMLLLDRFPHIRGRALPALAKHPELFAALLAMHVGKMKVMQFTRTSAALGWAMVAG